MLGAAGVNVVTPVESTEYEAVEEQKDDLSNSLTSVQKDNLVAMRWQRSEKGKASRKEFFYMGDY